MFCVSLVEAGLAWASIKVNISPCYYASFSLLSLGGDLQKTDLNFFFKRASGAVVF